MAQLVAGQPAREHAWLAVPVNHPAPGLPDSAAALVHGAAGTIVATRRWFGAPGRHRDAP